MKLWILAALMVWGTFAIQPVHAHSEDSDGEIYGTLHPEPDHDPVVGLPSTLNFFMERRLGEFDPSAYMFLAQIVRGASTTTLPVETGEEALRAYYTFLETGEYQVLLYGSSTVETIPSFSLQYPLFVAAERTGAHHGIGGFLGHHGGHALIVLTLLLGLIGVYLWERAEQIRARNSIKKN
jgi:hypothetical protein